MRNNILASLDDHLVNDSDYISPETLVLTNTDKIVVALSIGDTRVILLWSPETPEHILKRYIDNIKLSGFDSNYMLARVGKTGAMIRYYANEPGYLVLKDAQIRYIRNSTLIGATD